MTKASSNGAAVLEKEMLAAFNMEMRDYSAEVTSVVQQCTETNAGTVTSWKIGLHIDVDPVHLVNSPHLHRHFKLVPRTLGKAAQQVNLDGSDIDINAFHVHAMEGVSEKCKESSFGFNLCISDGKKVHKMRCGEILLKEVRRDEDKTTPEPGCIFVVDVLGIPFDALPGIPLKGQKVDVSFDPKPEVQKNQEAAAGRKAKATKGQADLEDVAGDPAG